ncbi:MAG: acetate--CoA ligase [Candidatus Marinimicrobia bacterium]|nr:acetate--CoA ligase [Candidatus Neomarinimicrobiota bacterium]
MNEHNPKYKNKISINDYRKKYTNSVLDSDSFWEDKANRLHWYKKWNKISDVNYLNADIKWFQGGVLNACYNCLDRNIENGYGDKTAIVWEGNDSADCMSITYNKLLSEVSKFANGLKSIGVKKGDRVCIYMQMIPELAVAMLACARIGAVHSIVFGAFSSESLADRINDSKCKVLITQDTGIRGDKLDIPMKVNADNAVNSCPSIENVVVVKRTGAEVYMEGGRDIWWNDLTHGADDTCEPEYMDAEDPLFILYTSGSTGQPKGVLHTTGGYMVYASYTHQEVFDYKDGDIYWCTADIGWITGHSYIVYGPLSNRATTVMFEGVPNYPDFGRFWEIVDKYKVNIFYTAPTALRALMKEGDSYVEKHDLSSLKVLGTVGETIKEPEWMWYYKVVGKEKCPIVDTWWQTETGGILISSIPKVIPDKPTFATKPFIGIQPILLDEKGDELKEFNSVGKLCIQYPWPSIARTIWGDHKRYINTYFSAFENKYFTGDGAFRDEEGNFRITGRVDDVIIVSGHNLGTAPIEDAINEHELVAESAIVGFPHEIKGNALYGFITLKQEHENLDDIKKEINVLISKKIGPIAKLDKIQMTNGLPKTRSGKIMRRILRKIASKEFNNLGDISTLLNPDVVKEIIDNSL